MNLFVRDMERLTGSILKLAALVEEMIYAAIRSLCDRKPDVAEQVVREDAIIDRMEVRIEEDCLRILVLHDPVASDLRRVATVLKVNHELERMADLAVSIAQRALALADDPRVIPIPEDLEAMTGLVLAMVRDSIDAYVDAHAYLARAVIAMDDQVDRQHRRIIDTLKAMMWARPAHLDAGLHLFSTAAHLERIADHATNIAEEVVYLKEGMVIRHHQALRPGPVAPPARPDSDRPRAAGGRNIRPEHPHRKEMDQ